MTPNRWVLTLTLRAVLLWSSLVVVQAAKAEPPNTYVHHSGGQLQSERELVVIHALVA
jgi:hypothetical protein